jgi:hypothetical protein
LLFLLISGLGIALEFGLAFDDFKSLLGFLTSGLIGDGAEVLIELLEFLLVSFKIGLAVLFFSNGLTLGSVGISLVLFMIFSWEIA